MTHYKKINMETFNRRMYFDYFMETGTTIDVTSKIDVTKALKFCKKEKLSFYSYSIYCLTKVANAIENMKYDLRDGELILWDELVPSFTNFNPETELFYALWLESESNYTLFDQKYKQLVLQYKNAQHISPRGNEPSNLFNISAIPWLDFDGISANNKFSGTTLLPIVSTGKYKSVDGQMMMPVNLKVHHGTMDGFHISLFFTKLQEELNRY